MKELELHPRPEYDILDKGPLDAILESAKRFLKRVLDDRIVDGSWNLRESVWPALGARYARDAKYLEISPRLVLLPLSRIGAKGGFSGSEILLGYFLDRTARMFSSLPLVIKLSKREGAERKLVKEQRLAQSIRPYLAYHKDSFAVPIHLDTADPQYDVLWSPFALPELLNWGTRIELTAPDMRKMLEPPIGSLEDVRELITSVYHILTPLHKRAGLGDRYSRSLADEYAPYLRGYPEKWGDSWKETWGSGPTTTDLGREDWVNPIWVLDQLSLAREVDLLCGAVHGDLHPGNILYSSPDSPSVIDFGWADPDAHVAKDFVLLECNFRFTYLPGDVPLDDVAKLSRWLAWDSRCGSILNGRCAETVTTIETIRSRFRKLAGDGTSWDIEYILPMFFVSFGLLRYIGDYKNQLAARLTVLELAQYIANNVLPSVATSP